MSHKQDSRHFKPAERAGLRILFLALPILLLIAAVCIITWYVRRDTPGRTVRNTMKQISSLDESAILQIASSGEGEDSSAALEALNLFFRDFSCKVLSVSQDKNTASVRVRVTTPDARSLASDIRLSLLQDAGPQFTAEPQETAAAVQDTASLQGSSQQDRVYSLMQQCLSKKEYAQTETEGTVSLKKTEDGWTIMQSPSLSSLLLGGFPEALSDPWLLSPDAVLTVFLERLHELTAEEWADLFDVHDLFSTYAADPSVIDLGFLTRAREAFAWSDLKAETSGSHADVSLTVTGTDTGAILRSYKEKLASYGQTVDAVSDDSYEVSSKSSSLLLEAIEENEAVSTYPVTVSMDHDGSGWVITDSTQLTDALFGGMSAAVEEFSQPAGEEE